MGAFDAGVLCATLIVLHAHKDGDFFGVCKPSRFHWRVWEEDCYDEAEDHGHGSDGYVEDSPAGKTAMGKADSVCHESSEDLGEGVADVEPGYAAALLVFLVPHGYDHDENGGHAASG